MEDSVSSESVSFDFISDKRFRNSLTHDYREITRCMEAGAWKAVHVLAGSVVESILVDYLIATDYKKRTGKDPLVMQLSEAIDACKADGVLSAKAADLSSVIRAYRNLIHPGRIIRLGETIDPKTGAIAKAVVDVVVEEVAKSKKEKYGFTAEQIVNKIERDSSSINVLQHFLKETSEFERERLLTDVIPVSYFEIGDNSEAPFSLDDFEKCFRQTFDTLPDDKKSVVSKQLVRVLKEESGDRVFTYETAFFRASDLQHLGQDDAALVKEHLLSRLDKERNAKLLEVIDTIGKSLDKHDVSRVTDALMRSIAYSKSGSFRNKARETLMNVYYEIPSTLDAVMQKRLDAWIKLLESKGLASEAEVTREIRACVESIPF
jgi:hypothetical protein